MNADGLTQTTTSDRDLRQIDEIIKSLIIIFPPKKFFSLVLLNLYQISSKNFTHINETEKSSNNVSTLCFLDLVLGNMLLSAASVERASLLIQSLRT